MKVCKKRCEVSLLRTPTIEEPGVLYLHLGSKLRVLTPDLRARIPGTIVFQTLLYEQETHHCHDS